MSAEIKITATTVVEAFSALKGQYAWLSRVEVDRVLRVEFGQPTLSVRDQLLPVAGGSVGLPAQRRIVRPIGQWSLFVACGLWRIGRNGAEIHRAEASNAEDPAFGRRILSELDGQKLLEVRWSRDTLDWCFSFDLGSKITIVTDMMEQDGVLTDQWTVFSNRGGRISCLGDDRLILKPQF